MSPPLLRTVSPATPSLDAGRGDREPPAKPVGAVIAALAILRFLGSAEGPQRLSDIVRALDLNLSTALNLLRTLDWEGLVAFDPASKRYALARGLADLAAPVLSPGDPARRLAERMNAAAEALGATVAIWTLVGEEVELTTVAESSAVMRIAYTVGRRIPVCVGAMGRLAAALGGFAEADLPRLFAAVPWARAPDYAVWLAEVARARDEGWALDAGHVNHGVLGIAVPVETSGPLRRVVAAAMFDRPDADPPAVAARLRDIAALV